MDLQKEKIVVSKFGGTAMADASNILKMSKIVKSDPARRFIVVSAPGKRFDADEKVTDLLYQCVENVKSSGNCDLFFSKIETRYKEIVSELGINISIDDELKKILEEINFSADREYAASRGEFLMAKIFACLIGYDFVDSAKIVKFDKNGTFDAVLTSKLIFDELSKCNKGAVISGFYGSLPNGKIKTFSRGGSDFTASLIAESMNANLCENWKDVNGFLVCDPKIVTDPKQIFELSHKELRELSYLGAYVLHPDSVLPLCKNIVPIVIKNAFHPSSKGTSILPQTKTRLKPHVIGIAGKTDFCIIKLQKTMIDSEVAFLKSLLKIFEELKIPSIHVLLGVDEICLIVQEKYLPLDEELLQKKIRSIGANKCTIEKRIALVSVIGNNFGKQSKILGKIFGVLAKAKIDVKTIEMGNTESVMTFSVDEKDYAKTINVLYEEFFGSSLKQ